MVRLALLLKVSVLGTAAFAVFTSIEQLGVPGGWSILLNVLFLGWGCHAMGVSLVGGLVKPDQNSSRAYQHFYKSAHLLLHVAPKFFPKSEEE
jgi:hypothetical protein